MALMDEFKEERESIKNKSFKEKLDYFWCYYKWWVILPIIIIVIAGNLISTMMNQPKYILDGMFINISDFNKLEYLDDYLYAFVEEQELDASKYSIGYNPNHTYISEEKKASMSEDQYDPSANKYAIQNVVAGLGSKSLNFVIGPSDSLLELDSNQLFTDLSEFLTDAQLSLYESHFIYIEETEEDTDELLNSSLKENAKKIPILIDISSCAALQEIYGSNVDNLAIGIVNDEDEKDMMLKFLDYIMR